jgi:predicted nucleic acid-binding protein
VAPSEQGQAYVFDADCLIELERRRALDVLTRLGDRVCIPTRVAREVNQPRTPLQRWLKENPGVVRRFVPGSDEEVIYYRLTLEQGPRLGDGEAAAIAMAGHRRAILVTRDRASTQAAVGLGVRCVDLERFLGQAIL